MIDIRCSRQNLHCNTLHNSDMIIDYIFVCLFSPLHRHTHTWMHFVPPLLLLYRCVAHCCHNESTSPAGYTSRQLQRKTTESRSLETPFTGKDVYQILQESVGELQKDRSLNKTVNTHTHKRTHTKNSGCISRLWGFCFLVLVFGTTVGSPIPEEQIQKEKKSESTAAKPIPQSVVWCGRLAWVVKISCSSTGLLQKLQPGLNKYEQK